MKIYISKSKLHGKGIFVSRDIKKGEKLFIIKGKKINFLIDSKIKARQAGLNWIGYDKNTWIDPVSYGLYINHSCEPNSAIEGRLTVVAIKNIRKGEELTFDYSFNESDIFWNFKCSCGFKNCRKTIRSIQFIEPKLISKNRKYIPNYFLKVFKTFKISNFKNESEMRNSWINFIKKVYSI